MLGNTPQRLFYRSGKIHKHIPVKVHGKCTLHEIGFMSMLENDCMALPVAKGKKYSPANSATKVKRGNFGGNSFFAPYDISFWVMPS
jgi:hypothetical protein